MPARRAGGKVTLNGVDLHELRGDDVRRVVGLCAQDAHLFGTTIGENIRLARRSATDGEIRDALRQARLLDWVEALPRGLDTYVGERGAQISGGQRQRIALARALLADFPVLLLDEPTEHLDTTTADELTADLLAATEGRTTLLITHRLAGLYRVDEIIVLDAGRVIERGSPARDLPDDVAPRTTTVLADGSRCQRQHPDVLALDLERPHLFAQQAPQPLGSGSAKCSPPSNARSGFPWTGNPLLTCASNAPS